MNLILVLLLAAVAWYLLSGLGTRQRVGGPGNQGDRGDQDFRVRTARSSTDAMNTTMNSTADNSTNQGTKWIQPEDAKQKNGQPSVSDDGTFKGSGQQGQQNNQSTQMSNRLASGTYNYGEDTGTLVSMQDQAGADQMSKDWQTVNVAHLEQNSDILATGDVYNDDQTVSGIDTGLNQRINNSLGSNGGQMANGEQTGLTQEIDHLYSNNLNDGGLGSYEGTNLGANTGMGGGMNSATNASGGTQEVNAYQPQLTGFSDATTTDEFGQKVTSIQEKRQGKMNGKKKS